MPGAEVAFDGTELLAALKASDAVRFDRPLWIDGWRKFDSWNCGRVADRSELLMLAMSSGKLAIGTLLWPT